MQKLPLTERLEAGLKAMHLPLTTEVQGRLLDYIALLGKWNAVHNLTAVRDGEDMVTKHLLDSLVLCPFLSFGKIADVGTGAGLPGIPLALAMPDRELVLLDSNQKKITFVQHVILSLKLRNVTAVCTRVEAYRAEQPFDFVVSRAFSALSEFASQASHLCKPDGRLIAMKGAIDPREVAAMSAEYTVEKIQPVQVPGLSGPRSLVFIVTNKRR